MRLPRVKEGSRVDSNDFGFYLYWYKQRGWILGDSGGVVNSLDLCLASLRSIGCFYFRCVLANFTLPTLKAFLEARSHNVSGNKQ